MRRTLPFLLIAVLAMLALAATRKPAAPKLAAPETIPHPMAMYLANLTGGGKTRITFNAAAVGTRFFFEEPAGVTVYAFVNGGYKRETFAKGLTLAQAMRKFAK